MKRKMSDLAEADKNSLRLGTLFTAQCVRDHLSLTLFDRIIVDDFLYGREKG